MSIKEVKAHIHERPLSDINDVFADLKAGRVVVPFG
jgi:D-arabinose 1-dehydrogenase-like Zn-dependent alcohol dehydrogenase